jgi:hypothetical protein
VITFAAPEVRGAILSVDPTCIATEVHARPSLGRTAILSSRVHGNQSPLQAVSVGLFAQPAPIERGWQLPFPRTILHQEKEHSNKEIDNDRSPSVSGWHSSLPGKRNIDAGLGTCGPTI